MHVLTMKYGPGFCNGNGILYVYFVGLRVSACNLQSNYSSYITKYTNCIAHCNKNMNASNGLSVRLLYPTCTSLQTTPYHSDVVLGLRKRSLTKRGMFAGLFPMLKYAETSLTTSSIESTTTDWRLPLTVSNDVSNAYGSYSRSSQIIQ